MSDGECETVRGALVESLAIADGDPGEGLRNGVDDNGERFCEHGV